MWGWILSSSQNQAARSRQNRGKLEELEGQIHLLDRENASHPSMEKHKKITSLKFEYNQILSAKIANYFLYAKQKYFEFGDKPHKLLRRQLRKNVSDRMIHSVKSASEELLSSPKTSMTDSGSFMRLYIHLKRIL